MSAAMRFAMSSVTTLLSWPCSNSVGQRMVFTTSQRSHSRRPGRGCGLPPKDFGSHEEAIRYLGGILKLAPKGMIEESVVFGMRKREDGRLVWKYDPSLGGKPAPRPGLREWDLWEVVKTIRCPTLLLHGQLSKVVTEDIAKRMAADMPDCRVERVDNAGHALFTDQPDAFAASVQRFLSEQP